MPQFRTIALAVGLAAAVGMPATAAAKTCTKRTTGTCTDAKSKQVVKIANRAQTLSLKSVAVKIVGNHVITNTIGPFSPDFPNEIATAKGRFVVFVVTVTNRGNSPIDTITDLDFVLQLGGATYDNAFNAENLLGGPSLIHDGENNAIQPGLSATGYIAFDVAPNRTTFVRKNGNLLIDDESDKRVGVIRTYR
jgi:Domain of unknown function (DUF4352)